ncbi:MAG: glycoside hydrolase family 97 protein [Chitinophagaceae bacterium]|nr:glycoside hydrolase family 97 protein [Chitinophagaceae bacterium]
MTRFIAVVLALFASSTVLSQSLSVKSTDSRYVLKVDVTPAGVLQYSLFFLGKQVVQPSALGFDLEKPKTKLNRFELESVDSSYINQNWAPVWGEYATIKNEYKELVLHVKQTTNPAIQVAVRFRLFNDGLGFRYEFPSQTNLSHFVVKEENTQIVVGKNHTAFWIPGDYDTNEYLYNTTKLSEVHALAAAKKEKDIAVTSLVSDQTVQTPLLLKSADGLYISIHEAALRNYPAWLLNLNKSNFSFQSTLVPDAVGNKAYLQTPANTPWRTILVSNKATEILASTTILNLNEPSTFENTSFIKPQKFAGMWWEMHVGKANWPLAGGKHGANTENVKKYIDFAAAHKLDGVLVEGWNQGWEDWFGNWKENVFDFVSPYPDYDIQYLTKYAQSKGVRLIMHHETSGAVTNYERRMDTAYRFMNLNGINTVKTGYVGKIIPRGEHHDGQWMVNHYERVASKAGSYGIMVDAHESVHPTGLHRTFPNWMANEAARGTEFNNAPTLGITPEHTTIIPFTRLMGGPMDFTPGMFHMKLNQFDPSRKTVIRTTLAKQLAFYITIYSPLQMVSDLPENYEGKMDAFQFIEDVPVDWADTKILAAEPGDYLAIARKDKKSEDWYLGAVTDENKRALALSLNFLSPGKKYEAIIYADADNADFEKNPEAYKISKQMVQSTDQLSFQLARSGGVAVRFRLMD